MDYTQQFTKLKTLLVQANNNNLVRDFFIQLTSIRQLDHQLILNALDNRPVKDPPWLVLVSDSDLRNIVVFLMWKEFQTVIDAKGNIYSEESKLGTKIEDLSIYLETKYYVNQISNIKNAKALSYTDWVQKHINMGGLKNTIHALRCLYM